jgi:hypothetical protein
MSIEVPVSFYTGAIPEEEKLLSEINDCHLVSSLKCNKEGGVQGHVVQGL